MMGNEQWCDFGYVTNNGLQTLVFIPIALKIILVLRLIAAWNGNRLVSSLLYFLTGVEALTGIALAVFSIYFTRVSTQDNFPLMGCWTSTTELLSNLNQVDGAFMGVRAISTLIETVLTLIKFVMTYKEITNAANLRTVRERIEHVKVFTPLLYVYFRDGTLLFFPCDVGYVANNGLEAFVVIPITMKIILVLRLKAAWNDNRFVSTLLYFLTGAEALIGITLAVFSIYFSKIATGGHFPLWGCWTSPTSSDPEIIAQLLSNLNKVDGAFMGVRAVSTLIETILTLTKFVVTYKETNRALNLRTFRERIKYVKVFTPLLYVYYRDGTLLFFPILILSVLELLIDLSLVPESVTRVLNNGPVRILVIVVYYIVASRLILNIREAGTEYNASLLSSKRSGAQSSITVPRFYHSGEDHDGSLEERDYEGIELDAFKVGAGGGVRV
ncbi:hypothetical protein NP233_g9003 [Leucocoprinus birnbaumii]|uniref:Uncharacterized protein n=1 Tax=Leucocoprinus birnbaumii TaxID=56174 RepID=A0AAD5VL89_9AGAR|nr:hypothetical protein NP233_g9003 [Leucocoprinus birnbaumii]